MKGVACIVKNWKKDSGITDDCLKLAIAIPLFSDFSCRPQYLMYDRSKLPIFLFSYFYAVPMTNTALTSKI